MTGSFITSGLSAPTDDFMVEFAEIEAREIHRRKLIVEHRRAAAAQCAALQMRARALMVALERAGDATCDNSLTRRRAAPLSRAPGARRSPPLPKARQGRRELSRELALVQAKLAALRDFRMLTSAPDITE